ncbi:MAG: HAMP domain-containing protein [Candidatus Kapabacteria bacterium]|nr:HAMP domain-containing protein [Candidatus Kapabacteria bacterium]
MFEAVKLTLRAKLALTYGTIVALTLAGFAAIAYVTVSNELLRNLDASLQRAGTSLLDIIRKEQQQARKPLASLKSRRRISSGDALRVDILDRPNMRNFVGPVLNSETVEPEDPVWSAVYEHMLLNSSNTALQLATLEGGVAWKSERLGTDSLPTFGLFAREAASATPAPIFSHYWLRGERYRIVMIANDVASVTAAYPLSEVDQTLRRLFSLLLYGMPLALVVSGILGWFIARSSLKSVDDITQSARSITASNLQLRLPKSPNNDEIARLIDTLNDMIARLEQSFAQVRQFTSDASHELKTPLAILMGELGVALRRPMTAQEYQSTLASCLEEVERLANVVQGLLEISRAESGQVTIERKPLSLSGLVGDICDDMLLMAESKHVGFTTDIAPDVKIVGDKTRLHQAVLNIVENAIKYTPEGGSVRVELLAIDGRARLLVSDTGIGIAAEDLAHIYDRFFRVDKARSQNIQGTGLGLSIVKWILDAHQATIDVVSAEGSGTTFKITFVTL